MLFVAAAILAASAVLYWIWKNSPVVIIFGGATTETYHFFDYIKYIKNRWCFAKVVVLCPMSTIGYDWWAEPAPLDGDLQYFQQLYDDTEEAYRRAYDFATNVNPVHLLGILEVGMKYVSTYRRLFVIGFSNGCIPAVDLAHYANAQGIWLGSGLLADHQAWSLLDAIPKKVATISIYEKYWGGCRRIHGFLQNDAGFFCLLGEYAHAREDSCPNLIKTALANL